MKTNVLKLTLLIAVLELFSACTFFGGSLNPSKTYITRNYKMSDFTAIEFDGVGNIDFTQSKNITSLSIYGPDNYVNLYDVKIEDGILKIAMKSKQGVRAADKLKISVSAPMLTNITSKGVGNINIHQLLGMNNLEILNKGVGNIRIDSLSGNSLTIDSKGVGNVKVAGQVHVASLTCNGVGNIEAHALASKVVEANCRGVGSISCYATDSITAAVKGVGSIKYKGQPKQKDLDKSGIGSIKQMDN